MTGTYQNRGYGVHYVTTDVLLYVIVAVTLAIMVAPFLGLL